MQCGLEPLSEVVLELVQVSASGAPASMTDMGLTAFCGGTASDPTDRTRNTLIAA